MEDELESTEDQRGDDQEGQGEPERSLNELAGAAQEMARFHRATEVTQFFGDVSTDADLDLPGADEALTWLDEHGFAYLAEPLRDRRDSVREKEKSAKLTAKESQQKSLDKELIEEITTERTQKKEQAERDRRKHELEEQLDTPVSDGGESGPEPKLDAGPFKIILEGPNPNQIFVPEAPPGERKRVLDARFQVIEEQQPFLDTVNRYENAVVADSGLQVGVSVTHSPRSSRASLWHSGIRHPSTWRSGPRSTSRVSKPHGLPARSVPSGSPSDRKGGQSEQGRS